MKKYLTTIQCRAILFSLAGLSVATAHAQESADDSAEAKWQVHFSANTLFNVTASFKGHPGLPALNGGGGQPGAENYDNGFVGLDVSGDPGLSTYWGYNNASQLVTSGGNVTGVNYQRASSVAPNSVSPKLDSDPSVGAEINFRRQLTKFGEARFGVEFGASYNKVDLTDTTGYFAAGAATSYGYNFAGPINANLFPPAGYQGPFDGAGPIINPTPTTGPTVLTPNAVFITGKRDVEANIFGLRLGPYLELPLTKRFSASLSGGAVLAVVCDSVSWRENLLVNNVNVGSSSVSDTSCGVTAGFYVGADASFRISENWSAFAGFRYQDAGTYTHSLGRGQVDLNLGETYLVNLGIGFSF